MDKIAIQVFGMGGKVVHQTPYRVTMMMCCALNRAHSFFLDELRTNLPDFTLTDFPIVNRSPFCLNKILPAMKTKKLAVSRPIDTSLDDVLVSFFPKKRTSLILTYNRNPASWSRHVLSHLFTDHKEEHLY